MQSNDDLQILCVLGVRPRFVWFRDFLRLSCFLEETFFQKELVAFFSGPARDVKLFQSLIIFIEE